MTSISLLRRFLLRRSPASDSSCLMMTTTTMTTSFEFSSVNVKSPDERGRQRRMPVISKLYVSDKGDILVIGIVSSLIKARETVGQSGTMCPTFHSSDRAKTGCHGIERVSKERVLRNVHITFRTLSCAYGVSPG